VDVWINTKNRRRRGPGTGRGGEVVVERRQGCGYGDKYKQEEEERWL
jgi:hypothetical protein